MARKKTALAVAPDTAQAVTTTVQVNEKIAEAIENVRKYHPHVKIIYVNADGHYHFHNRPGFSAISLENTEIVAPEDKTAEDGIGEEITPAIPPSDNLEF